MAKKTHIETIPQPEVMDDSEEAGVYDAADFSRVNRSCARRICKPVSYTHLTLPTSDLV